MSDNGANELPSAALARVLVVDDETSMVRLACYMLTALGFQVDSARNGTEAMRCFEDTAYDLVLSDLQMPGITGQDLAVWIKTHSPETVVIMMTGCPSQEVNALMMAAGAADHWIFKPFRHTQLKEMLGQYFELRLP